MNFIKIINERKIIEGCLYRRYFIDSKGNPVGIPVGVSRIKANGHSYIAKINNKNIKTSKFGSFMVPYHDAATQEEAYIRVIKIVDTLSNNGNPTAPKADRPSANKDDSVFHGFDKSTLPAGLSLHYYEKLNRVVINVCYFDEPKKRFLNKSVHVGTRDTWTGRLGSALAKATELRQTSLARYNELTNRVTENA